MKTKELIERLKKADPSGELECCLSGTGGFIDILCLEVAPAYWDGCLQVLVRDESSPFYNIIGAKYTTEGSKLVIKGWSIEDALYEDPNLPVEVIDGFVRKKLQERVDHWREGAVMCRDEFVKWKEEWLKNNSDDGE